MGVLRYDNAFVVFAFHKSALLQCLFIRTGRSRGKIEYFRNAGALRALVFFASSGNVVRCNAALFVCRTRQGNHRAIFENKVLYLDHVANRIDGSIRGAEKIVHTNAASFVESESGVLC